MKRIFTILLSLMLSVILWGCGGNTPDPVHMTPDPTVTPDCAEPAFDPAPLRELLTDLPRQVQPGASGSSLRAAERAAALMDWSRTVDYVDEAAITAVAEAAAEQALFHRTMALIDEAHSLLLGEEGPELSESCGYDGDPTLWTSQSLTAYEALMAACGLR